MRQLKNQLTFAYPDCITLMAKSNVTRTDDDIMESGKRLATEVKQFIQTACSEIQIGKLSFIGFSMGGVIIRAALPYLAEYSDKFFTFLTLSSPHMGYLQSNSSVISTGIWLMKKSRKSTALSQLSMTDSDNLEDCCLYRLSLLPGLDWFKQIILCGSYQDKYAPLPSARIQIDPQQ